MASIRISDENPNQQEEAIIPVLTVFKNKSIIKNICIILNNTNNTDDDHSLLIGRHPSCNIVLTHPSISRFHLKIRFTPSSRSIFLLDLSSVHGTWVSGRKLEHGVSVELKGGDSFRVGVSSRVYLLHFVSKFDANALKEETFDDDTDSFGTETSCCDGENESQNCFLCPPYVQSVDEADSFLSPPYVQTVDEADNTQVIEACPEVEVTGETNLLCTLRECFKHKLCNPVVEANKLHHQSSAEKKWIAPEASFNEKGGAAVEVIPKESDFEGAFEDSDNTEDTLTTGARVFNSEDMPDSESHQTNTDEEVSVISLYDGEKQDNPCHQQGYSLDEIVKNMDPLTTGARVFNSEDMPDSESHQTNIDEEVSVKSLSDGEKQDNHCHQQGYSLDEIVKNMDPSSSDENGVAAMDVKPREHKLEFFFEENARIDNILTSVASLFISENTSSLVDEANLVTNFQQNKIVEEVIVDALSDGEKENKCDKELQAYLNFKPCDEEGNSLDETVEDTVNKCEKELQAYLNSKPCDEEGNSLDETVEDTVNKCDKELQAYLNTKPCDEEGNSLDETVEDTVNKCDKELQAYLNTKPCDEEGNSLDETVEDTVNKCDKELQAYLNTKPCDEEGNSLDETVEDTVNECEELQAYLNTKPCDEEGNSLDETVEDTVNKCDKELQAYLNTKPCDEEGNLLVETVVHTVKSFQTESLSPSVAHEADLDITEKKENQTPLSRVAVAGCFDLEIHGSCVEDSAEGSSTVACDKAASAPQNQTRKSRLLNTPNVDTEFVMSNLRDISVINKPMSKDLFSVSDEEMFTPNKENSSPTKIFQLQLIRKKGNLDDSKTSKLQRSKNLKASFSPNFYSGERSTSAYSNKENLTPKESQQWQLERKPLECHDTAGLRKKRVERTPLQSLMSSESNHNSANSSPFSAAKGTPLQSLMSSGGNHNSANSSLFYSPFSVAKGKPLQSLMSSGGNRNSANSSPSYSPLSAAKSILGVTARTSNSRHISDKHIEPSPISEERKRSWDMVVDTASLLNKESRKALHLLQGLKGTRLIIPQSVIRELGSMKQRIGYFGYFRKIPEATLALEWIEECIVKTKWWIHILDCDFIVVEDRILDCALQYRGKDNVGQLVLLSHDVNLKIKSMAKGLLCETVEQFRWSLVNPFSERFMWTNSSPRGLTWSCQDDVVLREKYCCLPSKAGLKLLVT